MTPTLEIDDQIIALITERVVAALRDELEAIALSLAADRASQTLSVGEVAERFGVARSTVYAHWQEWGGYKLGEGAKAPIRFARSELAIGRSKQATGPPATKSSPARRRRARELISDAPRFDRQGEELG
jgi:transposase-like protein